MKLTEIPTIDSHFHIYGPPCLDYCRKYRQENRLEAVNIACLCNFGEEYARDATQNILALILKLTDSHFYAQAGLVYPAFPVPDTLPEDLEFGLQAKEFQELGFDGVKMLEGKPTERKLIGLPLSSPLLDSFYAYMEAENLPLLSHVADPETFWDSEKAPAFAHANGWFYGDGSFIPKEKLYAEVDDVLARYPGLKVTFAHFYFLSDFPEIADAFFEKHPNVCFDLTPGSEMYGNFTRHHEEYNTFFRKWDQRLMLGTDNTAFETPANNALTLDTVRRFLATDDSFSRWGLDIRGLALPEESVTRICRDNFIARTGTSPKPVNKARLGQYIEKHIAGIRSSEAASFILDFAEKNL